jgi:HSP20 family molecular chaperone IbpA
MIGATNLHSPNRLTGTIRHNLLGLLSSPPTCANRALSRVESSPRFRDMSKSIIYLPSMDLTDTKDKYVVTVDLPGMEQAKINVRLEGQTLRVWGKREQTEEQKAANGNVVSEERSEGAFERSVTMPGKIDASRMTTNYKNGVLTVTIPKAENGTGAAK